MTKNLLSLQLPRLTPNNESPTKNPSLRKERKTFQLPKFRKLYLERLLKSKGVQKDSRPFDSVNSTKEFSSSGELSSELQLPPLNALSMAQPVNPHVVTQKQEPEPRPGMLRRTSSLRLLKKPSSRQVNNVEGFRTMPRKRSSVRIAKHIGSSRLLLCRMNSQDELIVKPHQAEDVEDVSYIQLEIVPAPPKEVIEPRDGNDIDDDTVNNHEEGENEDDADDSDELSTASDPMCYLPVRVQQREEATDEVTEFEKNHKSLSAFSMLAIFLSSNGQSEASKRSRHRDAQTHC